MSVPPPPKRKRLQNMSPNVQRVSKATNPLLKPPTLARSQSYGGSPKAKLRRTSSLNFGDAASADRFIPSRHNSTSSKLETNTVVPHPNASPETHIESQTSKIYQRHVAEACGLSVNSRVLLYQPPAPERKKPHTLFNFESSLSHRQKTLRPAAAYSRAKKIPTAPDRVLDAPGLVDDFYLNLLSWSSSNMLAIGLGSAVYVWNASTGSVGLLCDLPQSCPVTSVRWCDDGSYVSVGRDDGHVEIWDIEYNTRLRTLGFDHATRVAAQSWHQHVLTSGSRSGALHHSDVRVAQHHTGESKAHSAEICGIEYRADGQQWASGGNDNMMAIWDARASAPLWQKHNHQAAVKALAWNPHQPSLLASGGGSSDKTIHFWNTTSGARVNTIESDSQISSLNWGYAHGIGMEIVATHGFPANNISVFQYPTLQKTGEIVGAHDSRLLSGCLSPDGRTLATIAGDENLKFWSLFDVACAAAHEEKSEKSENIKNLMALR
ncbi:APC/C activator protein Cdc20p [Diutina catenulata]